jgi:hypothetical protein
VTTIAREATRDVTVSEVKPIIRAAFEDVFGLHFEEVSQQELVAEPKVVFAKGA